MDEENKTSIIYVCIHIHAVELSFSLKVLSFGITWLKLEDIILTVV